MTSNQSLEPTASRYNIQVVMTSFAPFAALHVPALGGSAPSR
jgi:hypothetical protein